MLQRVRGWQPVGDRRDTVLVGSLAWLVMVAVANTGATAVAQPALRAAFGVGPAAVGWVVFGYTAAFAISTAWYGSLAARFGAGRTIAAGASVLGLGALIASVAGTFPVVVAARVAQGLGAGAIPTLAFAIASERLEGASRDRAIGYIVAGVGVGQALGPLLGGALIDWVSWRGAVAVGALALPATVVVARLHRGVRDPGVRLDLVGAATLAVVVGGATFVLNQAPQGGIDAAVLVTAVVVLVAAGLGAAHLRREPAAVVPLHVLAHPGFAARAAGGALVMAVFTAVLTGVPLVAGGQGRLAGVTLGLLMLPMALTIAVASSSAHRLPLPASSRGTLLVGFATLGTACLLAGLAPWAASLSLLSVALVPLGLAYALLAGPLTAQVSGLFSLRDRPMALGAYHVAFFVGGAAGGSVVAGAIDQTLPQGRRGFVAVMVVLAGLAVAAAIAIAVARRRRSG